MGTPIRLRLFLSCFLLIAIIAFAVDLSGTGDRVNRTILELGLCVLGAIVMTWIFSRAIEWRIQRLQVFAEHVLDASNLDEPLPEEGEETAQLNQSLRRMASRIRELVERLSLESARRDVILNVIRDHRGTYVRISPGEAVRADIPGGRSRRGIDSPNGFIGKGRMVGV